MMCSKKSYCVDIIYKTRYRCINWTLFILWFTFRGKASLYANTKLKNNLGLAVNAKKMNCCASKPSNACIYNPSIIFLKK